MLMNIFNAIMLWICEKNYIVMKTISCNYSVSDAEEKGNVL